ncbi:MAG: molybdopterin-binding protein [Desulfovibrio sp.]|jgi:molybdenum cofactor synthesis domain-containing protein|nr:molybdopterin-binding protein [Desulfovibrio sp.]
MLCHDITRIVPGESKGPVFRKGHIVTAEDIPVLLSVGKEYIYVFSPHPGFVHEDEAALRLAAVFAGANIGHGAPSEGRVNFTATCRGLLRIDVPRLTQVNSLGELSLSTLHSLQMVEKGRVVAGTRVVPLLIAEERLQAAEALCTEPLLEVLPLRSMRVGIVTTGSEIYHGRIKDAFGPVLLEKFGALGSSVIDQRFTSDDVDMTSSAIREFVAVGADMVVVTGGMSVDPDDRTPTAIRAAGAEIVVYGAPVYPGAMFLLARIDAGKGRAVPVLGLPGCVMYHKASIFDLIVPRLMAGLAVTAEDIAKLGHGGLCTNCPTCHYPVCAFGKTS